METKNIDVIFFIEDATTNCKSLFSEALSLASHGKVLYIRHEELNELPQLSQDLHLASKHYMKMISFLYAKTLKSLIESVSTLPDWQNIPSTVIIENLNSYYEKRNTQIACGIVALLIDTVKSCADVLKVPCRLYISLSKDNINEEHYTILKELYGVNE